MKNDEAGAGSNGAIDELVVVVVGRDEVEIEMRVGLDDYLYGVRSCR